MLIVHYVLHIIIAIVNSISISIIIFICHFCHFRFLTSTNNNNPETELTDTNAQQGFIHKLPPLRKHIKTSLFTAEI